MKKLTNLKGAKILNEKEQKSINGGGSCPCPSGYVCAEFREGTLGYWTVTGH